jgi:hypothetical protein
MTLLNGVDGRIAAVMDIAWGGHKKTPPFGGVSQFDQRFDQ